MTYRTAILLCAILLLGACGKSDNQPAPKLFQDQRNALDKAKAVDPAMQKQNEEQRKEIEKQEQ
jgi:major membrane immunogen (membrane-anchored lipoprotein)